MIDRQEASKVIYNKKSLYQAMQRNDWLMPKYRSSIVTVGFMLKIRNGLLWCPKISESVQI